MTEKQYKGIAGNFLICDVQKEYAEHLLSILVKRFGMRFQFHFFSNVKKIEQFAEKAEIEILLIAEDCVSEIRGNVKAKKKFILSESMKKEEKQQKFGFFFGFLTDCKNRVKQIMQHVKNNSKKPHGKEKQARAVDVCGERRYNKNPEKNRMASSVNLKTTKPAGVLSAVRSG